MLEEKCFRNKEKMKKDEEKESMKNQLSWSKQNKTDSWMRLSRSLSSFAFAALSLLFSFSLLINHRMMKKKAMLLYVHKALVSVIYAFFRKRSNVTQHNSYAAAAPPPPAPGVRFFYLI